MATNNPETDSDSQVKLSSEEKKFYNEVQPQTGYDCSIFMVGITGAGKSAFCNFLANEGLFEDAGTFSSVSQDVSCCRISFNQEVVLIIDSPGFCDSDRDDNEIFNELCKLGVVAKDGTDAVAIVISSVERFSDNHRKAFIMMEQMGGSFWEHAFIVFTNEREALRRNKVKTQEEYTQKVLMNPKCPPILKELLSKTENRYIFVDSIVDFKNENCRNDKCNQIFEFIQLIRTKNDNQRYNNSLMLQGRKFFEEREESDKKVKDLQEALKLMDIEREKDRAQFKKDEERRTQEALDARKQEELRKKETEKLKAQFTLDARKQEELRKEETEKLKAQFKRDEERRTQEALDARKLEELRKEETEKLKREQEVLKMGDMNEKTVEMKLLHLELSEMKFKLDMKEKEKDSEKAMRIEMERSSEMKFKFEMMEKEKDSEKAMRIEMERSSEMKFKFEMMEKERDSEKAMCEMKFKLEMMEKERDSEKARSSEFERELRDSRVRRGLEDNQRREEQVRDSMPFVYKQNVKKQGEKLSPWGKAKKLFRKI